MSREPKKGLSAPVEPSLEDDREWETETIQFHLPPDREELTGEIRADVTANLVIIRGENVGQLFRVEDRTEIGRAPACQVHLFGSDISRKHAVVEREREQFVLRDLRSINGTFVNGEAVTTKALAFGDRIRFGESTVMLFTEHYGVEEHIIQEQRLVALRRLAGSLARDYNAVFGTILANCSFLSETDQARPLSTPDVQEAILDVREAAVRAQNLTEQLLGFSRQGRGQLVAFDLSLLLGEVLRVIERRVGERLAIESEIDPRIVVEGDGAQLRRALMALYMHVVNTLPEGSHIRTILRGVPDGDADGGPHAHLSVVDDGPGLTSEGQQSLFEPFSDGGQNGGGLGLAHVHGVLKNHGGDIMVSGAIGGGTSFVIRLPLSEADAERPVAPVTKRSGRRHLGTVLVVDEDSLQAKSASRLLRQCGYDVVTAQSIADAVQIFEKESDWVQVVLIDLPSFGANGADPVGAFRAVDPEVQIVGMLGPSDQELEARARAQGVKGFVSKPYDREALEAALFEADREP